MKKLFASFFIMAFSCSLHSQSSDVDYCDVLGQSRFNTITTAVPFLRIAPDARAAALGDAGVSSSPDINSMHWNPAKYAFFLADDFYVTDKYIGDTLALKDYVFSAGLNYTPWLRSLLSDIHLSQAIVVYRPDTKQALAMSIKYFSIGDVNYTDDVGNSIGVVRPNELALDIAYARKLSANLSGAVAFRYIRSDLTKGKVEFAQAGVSFAADLAAYYQRELHRGNTPTTFAAGVNISNMGNKINYTTDNNAEFIPTNMRIGSSLTFDFDNFNRVSLMVDFNKLLVPSPPIYARDEDGNIMVGPDGEHVIESGLNPRRSVISGMIGSFYDAPGGLSEEMKEITISFGAEYIWNELLAFRTGYFYEHEMKGDRKFFTAGFGLKHLTFRFDFAYIIPVAQRSPLENVFRLSLGTNF